LDLPVNHKRVARLMRASCLQGLYRRRSRRAAARPATEGDLVARQFAVEAPDRLWFTDIERHEALWNPAVVKGHRLRLVAAGRLKLRAA